MTLPTAAAAAPRTEPLAASEATAGDARVATTSSQTVGPYLHIGMTWLVTDDLVGRDVSGDRCVIEGRVVDADGAPVDDAIVETWQANAFGRYDHPEDTRDLPLEAGFKGFGRVPTDASGRFRLRTIKPGRVPAPDGSLQAPHINVTVFMRGILKQLKTRIYFPGEAANADDPVLSSVPADRRGTLIAKPAGEGRLQWDLVLQGERETVFFDF